MAAHYGDIPTGGTEIDVLPTNAAAYRVRLVVLRTLRRQRNPCPNPTCAGSDGHLPRTRLLAWLLFNSSTETFPVRSSSGFGSGAGGVGSGSTGEPDLGQDPQEEPDLGQAPQEEPDLGQDLHTPFR